METNIVVILLCSGLLVGFINTLAGGATIISLSVLMWLGLPISVANGTNRLAVFFQTITSVYNFQNSNLIDWKKSIKVAIPTVLGSIVGSFVAVKINEEVVRYAFVVVLILMLVFLTIRPSLLAKGNSVLLNKPIRKIYYLIFFIIGFYGGFLHVGVGFYFIVIAVIGLGYDVMRANVMKNLLVMLYVPFSLMFFIINDQIMWKYGLIHAVGNVIGAFFASKLAIKKGTEFIRWTMIVVVLVLTTDIAGIINIKEFVEKLIQW